MFWCGARRQHPDRQSLPQRFAAQGLIRVLTTDAPMTMDHGAQRLNVEVDTGNQQRVQRPG